MLKLTKCAANRGFNINLTKTEQISSFTLPSINGPTLELSESAKFLGTILDKRLNWNLNAQERVKGSL